MDAPTANSTGNRVGRESHAADLVEQLGYLKAEVRYNRGKINEIEETISTLAPDPLRRIYSTQDPTAQTAFTEDTVISDTEQRYMCLAPDDTIPEVRECNFAEFKNRFDPQGRDGCSAVDVLVAGFLLHQEIQQEHRLRHRLFEGRGLTPSRQIISNKALGKAVKTANANSKLMKEAQSQKKWPRRIRIQSPALIRILARVDGEKWTDHPRTYHRPFIPLIYHHARMQKALRKLERKLTDKILDSDSDDSDDDTDDDSDDDPVQNSPKALACLRAYVEYMDKTIMPNYRRFEKQDVRSNAVVRFSDLWYLFKTGEFVLRRTNERLLNRRDNRAGKRVWMTYWLNAVPERLATSATDDVDIKDAAVANDETAFSVVCYYIDYTGEGFCTVKKTIRIEPFSGEKPVVSLPVYPIRFGRDCENRLDDALKTGESLLQSIREKHCSYNGWTLARSPSGDPLADIDEIQQQPEHINSEVMVDFIEAFQERPEWRPRQGTLDPKLVECLTVQDDFRIRWWSGPDRASLLGETMEQLPVRSGVGMKQRNDFVRRDPFLVALAENTKRSRPTTEKDLTNEAKVLLTRRVYAYVFQDRKFAQLAVAKLRLAPKTGLALDSLKIPRAVKDAIQGSIQGHFLQKNAERKMDQNLGSLDLIQGKGTGLFVLLHGVPGVGKTATAEAIAQANGKPLFKITAGDLGLTPEKLEKSLCDIFRLASIWDCILLLDEVDTFFSQRSRADTATNKNALVSVFLRVLDYYDGVLFLTTNRAGVFDEAFISRIHHKILYPELILEQTLDIWKLNIRRVREIDHELAKAQNRDPLHINEDELLDFATHLFHAGGGQGRRGSGRWNGRQIRNAFQVARSLAYYEHDRDRPSGPPTLSVQHFKTMHDITASFEHYRTTLRGGTEADLALEAEARDDSYQDHLTQRWQGEYQEEHHKEAAGNVAVTTTVAVTGRGPPRHRMQQHQPVPGDDDLLVSSPVDNHAHSQQHHRESFGSGGRNRSSSYLSRGAFIASPNNA